MSKSKITKIGIVTTLVLALAVGIFVGFGDGKGSITQSAATR